MPSQLLKIITEKEKPILIADFVLREDLLFLLLANYSLQPALNVKVQFNQPLPGLPPIKDFTQLSIFTKLRYVAPLKEFEIVINKISTILNELKKKEIEIRISFEDEQRNSFEQRILHDLSIYQDFPIIIKN